MRPAKMDRSSRTPWFTLHSALLFQTKNEPEMPPLLTNELHSRPNRPVRILQFGEGNFLRCFVDWIVHRMNQTPAFQAGVAVIQPIEKGTVDLLNQQDGLYTVCLQGLEQGRPQTTHELIDCIRTGINPYEDYPLFLKQAENPDLRFIISNTTEAGITFDEEDQPDQYPHRTFPAKLTALLYRRFRHFKGDAHSGCILLPCELIDHNGDRLREAVLHYTRLWKLEDTFHSWLEHANIFCNTLVDRIVPGFPEAGIAERWKELGYRDNLLTVGERFHLWVIEGPAEVRKAFPADRAGLNVVFTDDLTPYRTRKVRILNGAHTAMVPVGYLSGLATVREAVDHAATGPFVRDLIFEEIIPTLNLPAGELTAFAEDVLDRFRNPYIRHELISIALNSTSKFVTRVLPSLREYAHRSGGLPDRIVFALAALIRFYQGEYQGEVIPLRDDEDRLAFFRSCWTDCAGGAPGSYRRLTESVLGRKDIWGIDLNALNGLTEKVAAFLAVIDQKGVPEALKAL